ncbi:hypothetical protein EJ110_NYTH46459 [Nymphaea thermarum]|nr:hypothetical protein EJ110_NYTH46459 [Nymphaea thermarum]
MSCMNDHALRMSSSSNLDRFLDCTTPSVPAIPLKKGMEESRAWEPLEEMPTQYFGLGDLWRCFDEWSAYGVGVPVVVNGKERVVQYYVPYLSALQIYTTTPLKTALSNPLRNRQGDCNDSDTHIGSETSSSSDSESSRSLTFRSSGSGSEKSESWDCGSDDSMGEQDSSWCPRGRLGHLYLEYFEHAPPHARAPLLEKINQLSQEYPELYRLRSIDLSAASWISVAWYPIYHIPARRAVRDLSACFLTYHTLSFPFQGTCSDLANHRHFSCSYHACLLVIVCVDCPKHILSVPF